MACMPSFLYGQEIMPFASFVPMFKLENINANEIYKAGSSNVLLLKGDEEGIVIDDKGNCLYKGVIGDDIYKSFDIPFLDKDIISGIFEKKTKLWDKIIERAEYNYLTKNDSDVFCVVTDSLYKERTPNGHIGIIQENGKVSLFAFLFGEPVGLCCSNEFLWYLYNAQDSSRTCYLAKYSLKDGTIRESYKVNISNPLGLVFDNGLLITYSNRDGYLYKLDVYSHD